MQELRRVRSGVLGEKVRVTSCFGTSIFKVLSSVLLLSAGLIIEL